MKKKYESPIMYTIYHNYLTFSLENKLLNFKAYSNIIDINTLNSNFIHDNNFKKIKQIRYAIYNYYFF